MRRVLIALIMICLLAAGFVVTAQDDEGDESQPLLQISVLGETCSLVLPDADMAEATAEATDEATPEAEATDEPDGEDDEGTESVESVEDDPFAGYEVITLGDDCEDVFALLRTPSNGRLWVSISAPDEEDWQAFETVEDDPNAPQLDRRGRFIGCAIPVPGEQICRILWTLDDTTYLIELPIFIGNAFTPRATFTPAPAAQPTSASGDSGNPAPPPPTIPPPQATEDP